MVQDAKIRLVGRNDFLLLANICSFYKQGIIDYVITYNITATLWG